MTKENVELLSAELERKLLRRLVDEWESINFIYFDQKMKRPILQLSDTRARLGQWNASVRTLEISRPLVLEYAWAEVIEVLKHEVAHQFVDEVLQVEESAHGPSFREICERMGIEPSATGMPTRKVIDDDAPESRLVARIHKLLALAQSPNQHEAETAATTARRLMFKFNIDIEREAKPGERRYSYRHLGKPTGRVLEHERRLAHILTRYFFVEGLWVPVYRPLEGKRGSVFEVCGLPHNLEMAEYVHQFLLSTAERLWKEYRHTSKRRSNRDRQSYITGVMRGFEEKLAAQARQFHAQGLVWVPQADLKVYYRRRYPKIQTFTRAHGRRTEAYMHGSEAGRNIVLSQPVQRDSDLSRPKALTY